MFGFCELCFLTFFAIVLIVSRGVVRARMTVVTIMAYVPVRSQRFPATGTKPLLRLTDEINPVA
jgi:hypothetical protein